MVSLGPYDCIQDFILQLSSLRQWMNASENGNSTHPSFLDDWHSFHCAVTLKNSRKQMWVFQEGEGTESNSSVQNTHCWPVHSPYKGSDSRVWPWVGIALAGLCILARVRLYIWSFSRANTKCYLLKVQCPLSGSNLLAQVLISRESSGKSPESLLFRKLWLSYKTFWPLFWPSFHLCS